MSGAGRSAELFSRASAVIPGGVNSPVRAFGAVGGIPVFMASGDGAYLTDVDGQRYVDLVCSWGPMILGHAHPDGGRRGDRGGRPGHLVRHRHRRRGGAGRGDRGPGAGGEGPAGQLGHRGHHDRGPAGPRLHRAAGRGEVRRLLPRARGRAAGRGRVRGGHLRAARLARSDGRRRGGHPGPAVQRRARGAAGLRRARAADRLRDHRGVPGQHGRGAARRPASTSCWPSCAGSTARC